MILIFEKNYINSKQHKIIPSNLLFYITFCTYKSIYNCSRPEVFCEKVFLEILQCSQENTCARVYFFFKKKRLWHRCFPVNFSKFLKITFLTEHLRWLLLDIYKNIQISIYTIEGNSL